MIKRLFTSLSVLGLLQVLLVACCPDPQTYYSVINGVFSSTYKNTEVLNDSSVVALDDFQLMLGLEDMLVTEHSPVEDLISSSYALSCDDVILAGTRSPLKDLRLKADKDLFGIAANEVIPAQKFRMTPDFGETENPVFYEVSTFLDKMNNEQSLYYLWYIQFNDTTSSSEYIRFKLELELEDGNIYETQAPAVRFN